MFSRNNLVKNFLPKHRYKPASVQKRSAFYNEYQHGPHKITNPDPNHLKRMKELLFTKKGREELKNDLMLLAKQSFTVKFNKVIEYNKTKIFEDFDTDESIKRWKPVADRDGLNGYSVSKFSRSPAGHGLFHGVIDNTIPDDGMTANSGFAAIIGQHAPREQLFKVQPTWDWTEYNCFEIKYRGDGRKYAVVLNTADDFNDLSYYDNYAHPIYTRGGPYWQYCRIPFSKFIYNYRSFIQDNQGYLPAWKIKFVAIALHDKVDGPFALEIDYIGLRKESLAVVESSAYETYHFTHMKNRSLQVECEAPERD